MTTALLRLRRRTAAEPLRTLALCLALAAASGAARAELAVNLLPNGEFDTDVQGWDEIFPLISSFLWQEGPVNMDADGCTLSGVAELGNSNPEDSGSVALRACLVDMEIGETYNLRARFFYPNGVAAARAQFSVATFTDANCNTTSTASMITPYAATSDGTGQWLSRALYVPVTVPGGTGSMEVQLTFIKDVGDDVVSYVYFDRVHLTADDWIYSEDFELGELCRWSVIAD